MKFIKNFIFNPLSVFCKHISNTTVYLLVFADIFLLVASASFSVWGKSLSGVFMWLKVIPDPVFIIIGVFGGCISGFILAKLLPELSNISKNQIEELKERCKKYDEDIKKLNDEACNLKSSKEVLEAKLEEKEVEIDRLKHQSIDITSFEEVMKIIFAEAKMRIKDVKCEWIGNVIPKSAMHRPRIKKYIGALEKEFTASLRIDLKKINIRLSGKNLYVCGIKPEVKVENPEPTKWMIQEVQTYKLKEIGKNEASQDLIIGDDGKRYKPDESEYLIDTSIDPREVQSISKAYDEELTKRICQTDFDGYNMVLGYVESSAENFIRMLLKPCEEAGYKIIFPVEETVSAISAMQLEDFVRKFNNERLVCSNGKQPTLQNSDSITVCA